MESNSIPKTSKEDNKDEKIVELIGKFKSLDNSASNQNNSDNEDKSELKNIEVQKALSENVNATSETNLSSNEIYNCSTEENSLTNSSNNMNDLKNINEISKRPTKIPIGLQFKFDKQKSSLIKNESNSQKSCLSSNSSLETTTLSPPVTKIPIINSLKIPRKIDRQSDFDSSRFDLESNTSFKDLNNNCLQQNKNLTESTNLNPNRIPRCIQKNNNVNNNNFENNLNELHQKLNEINQSDKQRNSQINTSSKTATKRCVSLSQQTPRSVSVVSINENGENIRSQKFDFENEKNIKYIVRHRPRESQVKIFSQKLSFNQVSSKINSLQNNDHKPSGGNIKIENRKLNWNAQSKIRSLEKANYQPQGGNVKIESHKVNFKKNARSKTDTGLILIETSSQLESQFVSSENLNEQDEISSL